MLPNIIYFHARKFWCISNFAILETSFFYEHHSKCNFLQNFERFFMYLRNGSIV